MISVLTHAIYGDWNYGFTYTSFHIYNIETRWDLARSNMDVNLIRSNTITDQIVT